MEPSALSEILKSFSGMFSQAEYPNLLVGLDVSDDAAVYRINAETAVIFTVDFFTPVVDDPYWYGAVAAANAMSDIYAMGGVVTLALNICGFPQDLSRDVISKILKGGADKVKEAGGVLAGGHTVDDKEPKYGLTVMGTVHPDSIMTKAGAKPGDSLILTKPLGTGIITTAGKAGLAEKTHIEEAVANMARLSNLSAEVLRSFGVTGCTDVTGFGLLGHASEMAGKSSVRINLRASSLTFLPGTEDYAEQWLFPGGTGKNKKAFECGISISKGLEEEVVQLMYTPETSGGLLAAVPPAKKDAVLEEFERQGLFCRLIGTVEEGSGIVVRD